MKTIIGEIRGGAYDTAFARLYPGVAAGDCRERYAGLIEGFLKEFPEASGGGNAARGGRRATLVSAPGRTEICGNHTDHQQGNVLAAAVDLDTICIAAANGGDTVRLRSEGFDGLVTVDLRDTAPRAGERGDAALVRGIAAWFREHGAPVGGFDAHTTSSVLPGSGLSSSAAFEVTVGTVFNTLFDGGKTPLDIAIAGQFAENKYFGKPSGLMDQTASSVGGFVRIDFGDPANPRVEPIQYDLAAHGLRLCVVNTKGSHADLTADYANIPAEMRAVANFFGVERLREVDEREFMGRFAEIRAALAAKNDGSSAAGNGTGYADGKETASNAGKGVTGFAADRAMLRALHYFTENRRVLKAAEALRAGDTAGFLDCVIRSGASSFTCLQNIYAPAWPGDQGLSIALALSETLLRNAGGAGGMGEMGGAWRVHGGGFAGTIQAFVPETLVDGYRATLDAVFGQGSCLTLTIRATGGSEVVPTDN